MWLGCDDRWCFISPTVQLSSISSISAVFLNHFNLFCLNTFTASISEPQLAISFCSMVLTSVFSVLTKSYCTLQKLIVFSPSGAAFTVFFPFSRQNHLGQREICASWLTTSTTYSNHLIRRVMEAEMEVKTQDQLVYCQMTSLSDKILTYLFRIIVLILHNQQFTMGCVQEHQKIIYFYFLFQIAAN